MVNIILVIIIIFLVIWILPPYLFNGKEVTLKGTQNTYTVDSGPGGIFGHTHTLTVYNGSDIPVQYKNEYDVLFTCNKDFYHAHPNTNTVYGIKNSQIYNVGSISVDKSFIASIHNINITALETKAFHGHSLKITNTIPNV
jgi:hypothetical protein